MIFSAPNERKKQHRITNKMNIGRFYWRTKSANFCTTDNRFSLADFIGRQNRPTLTICLY